MEWNTVTTTGYDPHTGRAASITTIPAAGTASTTVFGYDLDGKITTVTVNGQQLAIATYADRGMLISVG